MVWKLSDLCIKSVQLNLDRYPDLGSSLPNVHKEMLVERLACHDRFFPDQITHISSSLFSPYLRHIVLKRCDQVTDAVLQQLGRSGCKLEKLVLSRLNCITDAGLQAVLQGQDALVVLHLKHLPLVTCKTLSFISAPKLLSFELLLPTNISKAWYTGTGLASFFSRNPAISRLRITIDLEHLQVIAVGLNTSLTELDVSFQSVTDDGIQILAQYCPNLRKLNLNGARYVGKEALIKLFQACTQMEDLDLGYCNRICSSPECEVLWTLPQTITTLSLCGLMLKDGDILQECIVRLPQLVRLKLCGVAALSDTVLSKMVEAIGHRLIDLNLSGVGSGEVTDTGLKAVAQHCTKLEAFQISLLRQVTGVTLRPIFTDHKRASLLSKLAMNSKLMDVSVLDQMVSSCVNLEMLDLSGLVTVTDALIISLAENAPRLSHLNIKGCKMLTDASICQLSGRCPLVSLVLSGISGLTDKSIFRIASSCPQLEEIYLNGCANISPVAVQYLTDCSLKRLCAKHNIPNASPNQLMAKNLDTGEFCRADLM